MWSGFSSGAGEKLKPLPFLMLCGKVRESSTLSGGCHQANRIIRSFDFNLWQALPHRGRAEAHGSEFYQKHFSGDLPLPERCFQRVPWAGVTLKFFSKFDLQISVLSPSTLRLKHLELEKSGALLVCNFNYRRSYGERKILRKILRCSTKTRRNGSTFIKIHTVA